VVNLVDIYVTQCLTTVQISSMR